jgi:hypothetical protein
VATILRTGTAGRVGTSPLGGDRSGQAKPLGRRP